MATSILNKLDVSSYQPFVLALLIVGDVMKILHVLFKQ